ncbi:MAG: zinc-binding alcohol dehydrogenase [Pseudomonadota bacterium]
MEIETAASLISRGTERLVLSGGVPPTEYDRMRAPLQEGDFPFPVKYGYAAAGTVIDGPAERIGQQVFALAPHQDRLRIPGEMALPLPEGVPPGRAVLAANIETALNAVWDAEDWPGIGPGTRVLVVGLGLVGLLILRVLGDRGGLTLGTVDLLPHRRTLAERFSGTFSLPHEIVRSSDLDGWDIAFHTSASAAGLSTALGALRFEGTVIECSWFGAEPVPVPLGAAFHSRRLAIKSSQVGHVARSRRAVTRHADRLAQALELARDDRLDALVTEEIAFSDLPDATPRLFAEGADGIATRIVYR